MQFISMDLIGGFHPPPHLDKDTGMLLLLFVCTLATYFVYH